MCFWLDTTYTVTLHWNITNFWWLHSARTSVCMLCNLKYSGHQQDQTSDGCIWSCSNSVEWVTKLKPPWSNLDLMWSRTLTVWFSLIALTFRGQIGWENSSEVDKRSQIALHCTCETAGFDRSMRSGICCYCTVPFYFMTQTNLKQGWLLAFWYKIQRYKRLKANNSDSSSKNSNNNYKPLVLMR